MLNLSFPILVMNDLVKEGLLREGDVTAFQSTFPCGLIDGLRDLQKRSLSNPVELFPFVWMASLSLAHVGDLVDLDASSIAIAYCDMQ